MLDDPQPAETIPAAIAPMSVFLIICFIVLTFEKGVPLKLVRQGRSDQSLGQKWPLGHMISGFILATILILLVRRLASRKNCDWTLGCSDSADVGTPFASGSLNSRSPVQPPGLVGAAEI